MIKIVKETLGRLTLTGKTHFINRNGKNVRMIEAICECGTQKDYVYDLVKRGQTRSCGCLKIDTLREGKHAQKHGLKGHRLYSIYHAMKDRCYYPKNNRYPVYGGRGITVCDEWKMSFMAFYNWAMNNGYRPDLTIERDDPNGNYTPDNCRWATTKEQARNKTNSLRIEAFGTVKCLTAWVEDPRCNVTLGGLKNRFGRDKHNWPDAELAITSPPGVRGMNVDNKSENRSIFAFGEEKSIALWLLDERCIVREQLIRDRLRKGWEPEKAMTTKERKQRVI